MGLFADRPSCDSQHKYGEIRSPSAITEFSKQMDDIRMTARMLAADIVEYMTSPSTPSVPLRNPHGATLRRVIDDLSLRHVIIFQSIIRKLGKDANGQPLDVAALRSTFDRISNEMFADGHYNWGRVVMVYAFAGWLAKHPNGEDSSPTDVTSEALADAAGEFVAKKLSTWICQQGGWDAMEEFFPDRLSFESALWHGLFVTLLTLGALAVAVTLLRR